jgi:hypothetical protein
MSSNKRLTKEKEKKIEGMERGHIGDMRCQMNCGIKWKACCLGGKE